MSIFELTILVLTFLISILIIWSSLRTGITPVPSSRKARQAMLKAAELSVEGTIIELGSGWGHLALMLADRYPQRQVIGYELSLIPWLVSLALKHAKGATNLTLRHKNFLSSELPPSTLIVCYLYPGGMRKLAEKLKREKPDIDMIISNTFALPETEPVQIIRLEDLYKSPIYVYRIAKIEENRQA